MTSNSPARIVRAIDHGAAAMVVSNHGGRQLDGVAPTLRVLPEVIAAANGHVEVRLDGGYTIFGRVTEGMTAVVDQTERGDKVETIVIDERAPAPR